jgi:hypothetical protein
MSDDLTNKVAKTVRQGIPSVVLFYQPPALGGQASATLLIVKKPQYTVRECTGIVRQQQVFVVNDVETLRAHCGRHHGTAHG